MVEEVEHGKDGVLREVKVKYCNSSEQKLSLTGDSSKDKTYPRYTIRTVRKMVKLFSIEDARLGEDIKEFQDKMKHMPDAFKEELELRANCLRVVPAKCQLAKSKMAAHCCVEHCQVSAHYNARHDHSQIWEDQPPGLVMDVDYPDELAWEQADWASMDVEDYWGGDMDIAAILGKQD